MSHGKYKRRQKMFKIVFKMINNQMFNKKLSGSILVDKKKIFFLIGF